MKAGLLFKLACLLIASMVLAAHFARKAFHKLATNPIKDNPTN
ncbi:hypothetical protein [Chitinophaga rhizophila]|nr:hypothetical protein [Chitinophaga rhizophila]